jgi:hypothetical protein
MGFSPGHCRTNSARVVILSADPRSRHSGAARISVLAVACSLFVILTLSAAEGEESPHLSLSVLARHSDEAPGVVILAQPPGSRHSGAARISVLAVACSTPSS